MLTDRVILLAGLCEIALPDVTVRLSDGGFVDWPARGMFTSADATFGTIDSIEAPAETVGDEAPGGRVTLLPPKLADAADLFRTDAQGSPVTFWLVQVDRDTGLMIGDPLAQYSLAIDTMTVRAGPQGRFVDAELMSGAERNFMTREGNVLSSTFHNRAWPGEKGFDFTTGAAVQVPWGVPDPSRGGWLFGVGGGGFRPAS